MKFWQIVLAAAIGDVLGRVIFPYVLLLIVAIMASIKWLFGG